MMEQKVNNQLKVQWELTLLHTHQKSLTWRPLSFSSLLLPFPWSPFPAFTYLPNPNLSNSLPPHLTWIQVCLFEMTDKNTYA